MVEVCAIASGSNGNCYYIGNQSEAILIDAGISCKQVLQRMEDRGLNPSKVRGIFITHEHADHIRGTRVLSKKLNVPAYFTYGTWNKANKGSKPLLYKYIHIDQPLQFGGFVINAFSKRHDANQPCSYRVEIEGKNVGVMTDIGAVCENVIKHIQLCDTVFLESNYDIEMLNMGSYPWHLKNRIASDVGHLSNKQAVELITKFGNDKLKTIFLSHLSGENNSPDIAYAAFELLHNKYDIIKTSRTEASIVKVIL